MFATFTAASTLGLTALSGPLAVQQITRDYPSQSAVFAASVTVPPGTELIFLSGQLPDVADATAQPGSADAYGDTEMQAASTFARIRAVLEAKGLTMGDVVSMTVYLVAPPGSDRMDFAGLTRAYSRYFGTREQPDRPSRSTVQVAGLTAPGFLVEIAVTAARTPPPVP